MISPILEKLTEDSNVKTGSGRALDLVTVDTDKESELAQRYRVSLPLCCSCFTAEQGFQIRSLPTVMAFKDGKPVNHFIGALSEGAVRKFLQQL